MENILLLHQRYTPDDQAIWKHAINNGWRTERFGMTRADFEYKIGQNLTGKHFVYYGNMLHTDATKDFLPVQFAPINPNNLSSENIARFLGRKIEIITGAQLKEERFKSKTFYKSASVKWIESKVYNSDGEIEKSAIVDSDLYYRQNPIDIRHEIRCFVINGEIVTASFYRQNKEFEPLRIQNVPSQIREMAKEIWGKIGLTWPNGIVFDFAQISPAYDKDGDFIFLEANEAYASGLYDCSVPECFETIRASQKSK